MRLVPDCDGSGRTVATSIPMIDTRSVPSSYREMPGNPRTVTLLLREWQAGDRAALEVLVPQVYSELHRIAAAHMRGERAGHTFRPTDLVSEAYLRLAHGEHPTWSDRIHFFAIASRTMRQVLVDHARKRNAEKRGAGELPITFDEAIVAVQRSEVLVALDEALSALERFDQRKARAVEFHYFGGMTHDEVAEALAVHVNTVRRDLRIAGAWISRYLRSE